MRRYHAQPLSDKTTQSSFGGMFHWNPEEDEHSNEHAPVTKPDFCKLLPDSSDENISLILKSQSGTVRYNTTQGNYNGFIKTIISVLLSFDYDIEQNLKQQLLNILSKQSEDFFHNDAYNDEGIDFQEALNNAQVESKKYEEAQKLISSLPKDQDLEIRILHYDESDFISINRILSKHIDVSPPELSDILQSKRTFVLPYKKATEVYIALRMLDVVISIKSKTSDVNKKKSVKKDASRSAVSKKSTKSSCISRKSKKATQLTGREKISAQIGLIK